MILRTFYCLFVFKYLCLNEVLAKPSVDEKERDGPCVGMDCLHGVLMHNDDDQGGEHKAEDQYLRFKSVLDTEKNRAGTQNAEQQLHGMLMHGDSEAGDHHEENIDILPEQQKDVGPKDLSEMIHEGMHGEEGHFKHTWDEKSSSDKNNPSGPTGDKLMHGLLMHGDENYEHSVDDKSEDVEQAKNIGPKDAAEYLHGVLMHGDAEPGADHHHGSEDVEVIAKIDIIGPNNDLHGILMHGDANVGHDHSDEDSNAEHEVFSDITKILEMDLDEDLLKMIDIQKILEKDRKEYADWILNNPQFMDESTMGSTRADISDTILDDIELMKKRYLVDKDNDDEVDLKKKEQDGLPFTAEDSLSVYNKDEHAEEGEDVRHDLELAGSTEPINARHKVKMALMKSTED